MLQKINSYGNKPRISNLMDDYLKTFLSRDFSSKNTREAFNYSRNSFSVDMYSDKNNLYVTAQLPGVSKDKINVELKKNNLSFFPNNLLQNTKNIIVEGNEGYKKAQNLMKIMIPAHVKKIKKHLI